MKAQILLVASLSGCAVACGGAPFSFPPDWPYDGGAEAEGIGNPDAGPLEATSEAATSEDAQLDAAAADVGPAVDASPPTDAALDAPPTCSQVVATPHDTCPLEPSNPDPFPSCYDRMAASPLDGGCPSINACEPTPAACQCLETFDCACLKANGVNWKNCVDVGGAPWIY